MAASGSRSPYLRWLKPVAAPFFDERCDTDRQYEDEFDTIYRGYVDWLEGKPQPTPSKKGFGMLLNALGFTKRCSNRHSLIRGVRLQAQFSSTTSRRDSVIERG